MQDYISIKTDINGNIPGVTVKQFDCNSRFLHVTLTDSDLPSDDNGIFEMTGCSARLLVSLGHDKYEYVDGEIADAEGGIVSFTLPGSVTQRAGTYTCEIRITEPSGGSLISTKPFKLTVETSLDADEAIEATPQYSALENALMKVGRNDQIVTELTTLAESGGIPAGTVEAEVAAARVGWDGTSSDNLAQAMTKLGETGLVYIGTFLNSSTWAAYKSGDIMSFDALPNNIFAVCNVTEAVNPIDNAPVSGPMSGLVLTFGRGNKMSHNNFDTQIFIPQSRERLYVRKYDGSAWSAWGTLTDYLPQYRAGINDLYASYNYLLSNVKDDGTFHVSQQDTSGGTIVQRWSDLPDSESNFIVTNSGYSTNWILQTAIATNTYTDVYRRIIPRPGVNALPRNWVKQGYIDPRLKILAVGDSICAGARNGEKGFVGDLGLPAANVKNEGLSGTTMSNYLDGTIDGKDKTCIPKQLARVSGFQPDIIIANGGHNDYNYDVQMGDIPVQPTTDMNTLDASTVMGGLQRLFLTMIQNYPSAERYFVTTHKIYRNATVNPDKNGYLPTKNNSRGYSETDLHDAIVQCCKVYNVQVIDVFEKSKINSLFDVYKGDVYYSGNSEGATEDLTRYFDADGVHPLERGYLEGYVPLIREAIRTGTVKGSDT